MVIAAYFCFQPHALETEGDTTRGQGRGLDNLEASLQLDRTAGAPGLRSAPVAQGPVPPAPQVQHFGAARSFRKGMGGAARQAEGAAEVRSRRDKSTA